MLNCLTRCFSSRNRSDAQPRTLDFNATIELRMNEGRLSASAGKILQDSHASREPRLDLSPCTPDELHDDVVWTLLPQLRHLEMIILPNDLRSDDFRNFNRCVTATTVTQVIVREREVDGFAEFARQVDEAVKEDDITSDVANYLKACFREGRDRVCISAGLRRLSPHLVDVLGNLPRMVHLDLGGNRLPDLPPEIGRLTKLESLILTENMLFELPDEICDLTNLRHLDVCGNKLTRVPENIGKLRNLARLDLGVNVLRGLPQSCAQLLNLEQLRLCGNSFPICPDMIFKLPALRRLDLSHNELKCLPASIGNLPEGCEVDATGNSRLRWSPARRDATLRIKLDPEVFDRDDPDVLEMGTVGPERRIEKNNPRRVGSGGRPGAGFGLEVVQEASTESEGEREEPALSSKTTTEPPERER